MAQLKNNTRVITNEGLFSYAYLTEAHAFGTAEPKFSVSFVFPKTDKETYDLMQQAIKAATEAGIERFGKGFKNAKTHFPIHDGDAEKPDDPVYAGCYYVNCSNREAPKILGPDKRPLVDDSEIYSGCYGKLSINFYPYSNNGTGVTASLQNVLKTRDGKPLGGGRASAEEDFGAPEDDDDFLS